MSDLVGNPEDRFSQEVAQIFSIMFQSLIMSHDCLFLLCFLQTYNPVEDRIKFYDKFFCRKIREEELVTKGNSFRKIINYLSLEFGNSLFGNVCSLYF